MAWRNLPTLSEAQDRAAFRPPPDAVAAMCVLASGSSGNCTLLVVKDDAINPGVPWRRPGGRIAGRVCLIDAGLSPARTRRLLAERGVRVADIDDVILTHLDRDHFHFGWRRVKDLRATLRYHRRHNARAERERALLRRNEPFDDAAQPGASLRLSSLLMAHDDLGVAVFRFELGDPDRPATLGFATDLGRVDARLTAHLAGVDTLAIESNYCPDMQRGSARPEFLKRRITGGRGHLSNAECLDAVRAIAPRRQVVFLHLSRECNRPGLVNAMHDGATYERVLTRQDEPTPWLWLRPSTATPEKERPAESRQPEWVPSLDASGSGVRAGTPGVQQLLLFPRGGA